MGNTPAMKRISYSLISLFLCLISCEEELPNVSGKNRLYEITSISDDRIDGQMIIRERNDGSTQLELSLNGVRSDHVHPAYIHFNTALEGGGIAMTLIPVDGNSSTSVTEITKLDSGVPISYDELVAFDGHINIQLDDDHGTVVAQADIGENALTGRFQQFPLDEVTIAGADGLLTIHERESGYSLLEVVLEASVAGRQHPTTLNFGSMENEGGIAVTLNPIDGDNGIGKTHLEELDGDLLAPYEALINFQGFIRVHLGPDGEMDTVVSEGNIAFTSS